MPTVTPGLVVTIDPSGTMADGATNDGAGGASNILGYSIDVTESIEAHGGGGTFTVTFVNLATSTSATTGAIAIGALGTTVASALNALASITTGIGAGGGSVTVVGDGFPYSVTFGGTLAGLAQNLFTIATGSLTANGSTPGTTAGTSTAVILDASVGATYGQVGAGWATTSSAGGFGGAVRIAASGTGVNSAEWTKSGLVQGAYLIYMAPKQDLDPAYSATTPVRVFDGTTERFRVNVDQQVVSLPVVLGISGDSTAFELIGPAYVTTGHSLRVLVTDAVQPGDVGKFVFANEIAIVPFDPTVPLIYDALSGVFLVFPGTWSQFPDGWNHNRRHTTDPSASVRVSFLGLFQNSTYKLGFNWIDASNLTPNAVCTVYDSDGVTVLGTTTFSEVNASSFYPHDDYTDSFSQTLSFARIGTFTPSGTSLYVAIAPHASASVVFTLSALSCILTSAGPYTEPVSQSVKSVATGPPSYTINGGAAIPLPKALWAATVNDRAPLILWPLPTPVLPTDRVTFTMGPQCLNTAAGYVPAITAQTAINKVGGMLGPPVPSRRTLAAGLNLYVLGYDQQLYFNAVKNLIQFIYRGSDPSPPAPTSDLLPTYLHTDAWAADLISASNPFDGRGYPIFPPGIWTAMWDATGAFFPLPESQAGTTSAFVASSTGKATDNYAQFNLSVDTAVSYGANFSTILTGHSENADDADLSRVAFTGTWTKVVNALAFNGSYHVNDATATSKATYTFRVQAGTYRISHSWIPSGANTSSATVVVTQVGGGTLATYNLNQTTTPASNASRDYSFQVIQFDPPDQEFTCATGSITVELTGTVGKLCIADAVQIQLVGNLTGGVATSPITNLRVYPPVAGVNPLVNPPQFNPQVMGLLKHSKVLRTMQPMGAIYGNMREITDYPPVTQAFMGQGGKNQNYKVESVATYANPANFFEPNKGWALITVSSLGGAPLSFQTGDIVNFQGVLTVPFDTSGGLFLQDWGGVIYHDSGTMSAGQFAIGTAAWNGPGAIGNPTWPASQTVVNSPFIPSGTVVCRRNFTGLPAADIMALVAQEPGRAIWLNLTHIVTQACVTGFANSYMAAYPVGSKVYLEFGNEPGNYLFPAYQYYYGYGQLNGLSPAQAYAKIAGERQAWFATALGARSGELIQVYTCLFGDPGWAVSVLAYCNAHSIPVGLLATAPYLSVWPGGETTGGMPAIYPTLTAAQLWDTVAAYVHHGAYIAGRIKTFGDMARAQGCPYGWYEGGIPYLAIGGTALQREAQAIYGHYHPLGGAFFKSLLALGQANGVGPFVNYNFDQLAVDDFSQGALTSLYASDIGYASTHGVGDGSDGLHDNRPDVAGAPPGAVNFLTAVSPIGWAIDTWNSGGSSIVINLILNGDIMPSFPLGRTYRIGVQNGCSFALPAGAVTVQVSGINGSLGFNVDVNAVVSGDGSAAAAIIPPGALVYGNMIDNSASGSLYGDIYIGVDLRSLPISGASGPVRFILQKSCDNGTTWPTNNAGLILPNVLAQSGQIIGNIAPIPAPVQTSTSTS